MPRAKPARPMTTVLFRTDNAPLLDDFARRHGLLKGEGPNSRREEPEPNRSAALNLLIPWALEHYPNAGTPEAEELKTAVRPAPNLTDRDRAVLRHLRSGPAELAVGLLQSEPVDPATGTVAGQTARRLERFELVEVTEHDKGRRVELTGFGRRVASELDREV